MTDAETTRDPWDAEQAIRQLVTQRVGQRLPSERDLATRLQISRPRLRAILAGLRAEGLVEQRLGSGTYSVVPNGRHLRRIALLIDDTLKLGDDPFFSNLLECLQAALQAEGSRCQIERISSLADPPPLEDGALTLGLAGAGIVEKQRPGDPPVVGLLVPPETRPNRRASVFVLEDRAAGRAAGEYLWARGCRDIVFAGRRGIPASRERLAGVEAAAAEAGARLHVLDTALNYAAGLRLGSTIVFPGGAEPVGLVAANDWLAAGLHAGLARHDAARGRDIRLASFDGLRLLDASGTDFVSFAVPIEAIAEDAVAELRRLGRSPVSVGRVLSYPLRLTP